MKLFKKLAININSRMDAVAERFENREALSSAYMREYERIVAKAKVRLAQVDNEVARLEQNSRDLGEKVQLWTDRARRIHGSDEAKALACVARMTKYEQSRKEVLKNLEDAGNLRDKMARDVDHILKKLEAHKRRHQNLTGRQVCAEAVHAMQDAETGLETDIGDLFTRWETDVVASELHAQLPAADDDPLDHEFDSAEQEQALRIALEEIIATPEPNKEKAQ
jgi:phage shock protein A